jgi:hypothetical protein
MGNAFRPPDNAAETREQLARLRDGLKRVGAVRQLARTATPTDTARKLNELIARLSAITNDGDGPPAVPTVVNGGTGT